MSRRDQWLELSRKLDWEYSYVDERDVFPESVSGKPWLPHAAWQGWDEPYRTSYTEYVSGQSAKDASLRTLREARFGAGVDADGRGAVDAYLEARGEDYARRTQPLRWLTLSEAIDRFSIEPGDVAVPTTLVASPSDQLAPFADIETLAAGLPRLRALHALPSIYGHDAFLKEPARLSALIAQFLKEPSNG